MYTLPATLFWVAQSSQGELKVKVTKVASLAVPNVCDTATRDRSNKFKISNQAMNLLFMTLLQNKPDRILIDNGVSDWTALIEDG